MSTKEIILDWLKEKANREKLTTRTVSESEYDCFKTYGHIYKYQDETVGKIGDEYFKLIKLANTD